MQWILAAFPFKLHLKSLKSQTKENLRIIIVLSQSPIHVSYAMPKLHLKYSYTSELDLVT